MLLDWISLLFISVVSLISSVVILYSVSYISSDKNINKFISIVFMFVVSIYLMIIRPNLISILLGWDGLGLVSYCLVVYYQNWKSFSAGIVTVLSNRIGDLAILLSICWALNFGSLNLTVTISILNTSSQVILVMSLVILAAITKRAQIPFSAWLPAAIAAPTPVSSLVHSSTLVTAGVYLLIRFNYFFELNYYLLLVSCATLTMRGVGAVFEIDLKKIIALSTLSQLGVIILILSLGFKELAFFHLVTHALFKSLLFLCAGFYIHSSLDWQDIRSLSKFYICFPVIRIYFSVASIALSGFPFLAGFYSKDLIIEMVLFSFNNSFTLVLLYVSTMITLVYRVRLVYVAFIYKINHMPYTVRNEDWLIAYPIFSLFILSIAGGTTLSWLFFPQFIVFLSYFTKTLVIAGLVLTFLLIRNYQNLNLTSKKAFTYFATIWYLPTLTINTFIPVLNKSVLYIKLFDQGWLEFLGGQGIRTGISGASIKLDISHVINIKQLLYLMFTLLILVVLLI